MYFETIAGDNELVNVQNKHYQKKFSDYEDESYLIALKFHQEFNEKLENQTIIQIDPTSDIYQLFNQFNLEFFDKKLSSVIVQWEKGIFGCVGLCRYELEENVCEITLNEFLLKSRSRTDLIETLLHEMIHAYLFITTNQKNRYAHEEEFLRHMIRINNLTGMNITIYHKFQDEIDSCRQHQWRCTGICQYWKPFYGYVKRSIDQVPWKEYCWFNEHKHCCNGQFIKVKGPSNKKKLLINNSWINEPVTKKLKETSVVQPTSDEFLTKATAFVECQFCHQKIHRDNLRLHLDIKCLVRIS